MSLGLGLGALALCQPVGVAAVAVGIVALRRVDATPGRPHRGLAIGGIVTGVLAVLMTAAAAWFYVMAVADNSTTVKVESSAPAVTACRARGPLSDPAC